MTWLAGVAISASCPALGCAIAWKMGRRSLREPGFFRFWLAWASFWTGFEAGTRDWPWAAGDGLSALVALALWWWSRRKGRKRATRLLGAKSRALRDALVKSMPRWSPRLQPQGVRA